MTLRDYARKRRFTDTPEPADDAAVRKRGRGAHRPIFVVQLHNARARHYDFRLEADGALKSWAVPKGPSLRVGEKRLAVQVEDHPISYAGFQGEIPEGNYGAGHVLVFDHGVWACDGDPLAAIAAGKLDFTLEGGKLRGAWKLVRTGMKGGRGGGKPQWLLIKRDDEYARDADADDLVEVEPGPESSARANRIWLSNRDGSAGGEAIRDTSRASSRASVREAPAASSRSQASPPPDTTTTHVQTKRQRKQDSTWKKRALALEGARDRPFPAGFKPELATLREHPPRGDEWLHEVKWDGYRMLVDMVDGAVKLRSRNDLDWTADFPAIAAAIAALPVSELHLDGELVALDEGGASDFALLQRTLQGSSNASLRYALFDMPGIASVDLSRAPLLERKALLAALLETRPDPALMFSSHVVGHGEDVFAETGKLGLEGIISKRVDAGYSQSRSAQWLKIKHANADEFAIVGYTAPRGARTAFGALLMATRGADGALRYVGRVGTGYDDETLRSLHRTMRPLERKTATLALPDNLPYDKRDRGNIHWLAPKLIAEVAFRGWGKDGLLRQASFQRLRTDKTLEDLRMPETSNTSKRETKAAVASAPAGTSAKGGKSPARARGAKASSNNVATARNKAAPKPATQTPKRGRNAEATSPRSPQVQISSRDRVVFRQGGVTKGDVADYYAAIADLLLPGMAQRPLSLLRCPGGIAAECFFQKHHAETLGPHVRAVPIETSSGVEDYLYVRDAAGLLELVQMNALEFHPWGARVDNPERPDTLVFDLDPGPGVAWKDVVAAARDVRARLQDAGLDSFVRLSGGKGVHVVMPIRRGPTWDQAKNFTGAFAEAMAAHRPLQYVANMSKARRNGRIFIDWLRNGRGATSVCSWSLRARDGAPVAVPIRWEELGRVAGPAAFDLHKALKRAKTLKADPWEGYAALKQSLPKLG